MEKRIRKALVYQKTVDGWVFKGIAHGLTLQGLAWDSMDKLDSSGAPAGFCGATSLWKCSKPKRHADGTYRVNCSFGAFALTLVSDFHANRLRELNPGL